MSDLVAALADPGFYPERPASVEIRETHISWVFLTPERAYKLKKPLVLPFLDYGTAERRREMCREEVRLNRVLAPDIYVGVRAIARLPDGFGLAEESDARAVDYVVEMRRYDEALTLAAKLDRGELRHADIVELARVLADFHAAAHAVSVTTVPALAIERRMTENFHELLTIAEQRAQVDRVLALERFAHAFVVAHAHVFEQRAREGFVRDVHGDLRAEHVVFDGRVDVVDCVEFNHALRQIDVADELAFLVMDLDARGGDGWADVLVHAYREAGGDPGDDRSLAFYASYRALVRAKVALLRSAQHPPRSAEHGRENATARELLALADRFAWRARLPLAIVVCGVPASGKTHLARALSDISRLPHISSDFTRKTLAGVRLEQPGPRHIYSDEFNRQTYAELGRKSAAEVSSHGGVIVDGTFRHRADRAVFTEAFSNAAPLLFVECQAPREVLAKRAVQRKRTAASLSDATLDVVLRERAAWEPLDEVKAEAHIVLRTDRGVDASVEDVKALLDGRLRQLA